jgi:hypothetical protein
MERSCREKKLWCAREAIVQGEKALVDAWSNRAGRKRSGANEERSFREKQFSSTRGAIVLGEKVLARARSDRALCALR